MAISALIPLATAPATAMASLSSDTLTQSLTTQASTNQASTTQGSTIQGSTTQLQTAAEQGSALSTMSNMLGGLIVVLALIFLLAYLLKRLKLVQNNHSVLKTLAVTPLGQKEKLVLAQVGDQQYLLGVTAQQVNLIDKLDTPVNVESSPFASRLQQARSQQAHSQPERDTRTQIEPTLNPSEDNCDALRGNEK